MGTEEATQVARIIAFSKAMQVQEQPLPYGSDNPGFVATDFFEPLLVKRKKKPNTNNYTTVLADPLSTFDMFVGLDARKDDTL